MIALTWQTMLLLAAAYFVGCIVGCFGRKLIGAGAGATTHSGVSMPVPVDAGAAPVVERTMPVASVPSPAVHPAPTPPRSVQDAFRRADKDQPTADDDAAPAEAPPAASPAVVRTAPPPAAVPAISAPLSAAAAMAERMAVVPPVPAAPASDDLTRIRAIDDALATRLNRLGVNRYAEIAAWTSEDVKSLSKELGFSGRIEHENWIEQAQILARGGVTSYATTLARPAEVLPVSKVTPPDVESRAAFAEPRREPPAPVAEAAPSVGVRDALQRIGGISAEIESVLNDQGITRYSQISGWNGTDVERLERLLGTSGRISRENWIEQAHILARGGATAYSRKFDRRDGDEAAPSIPAPPPAPVPTPLKYAEPATAASAPDLSGMRSVRSEAFRGADSLATAPGDAPDDLKRIRGIGVLIEKKLNAMGVTTYEQIANWTADDVGTVARKLDFKGRIERENWIEQARILASGGHTDFSRRFERGEV